MPAHHKRVIPKSVADHRTQNMPRAISASLASRANPTGRKLNKGKVELIARKQHVDPEQLIKVLEHQGYTVN